MRNGSRARRPTLTPLAWGVTVLGVVAALVFWRWPALDIDVAGLFHGRHGGFVGHGWLLGHLRRIADWLPIVICSAAVAALLIHQLGWKRLPAPSLRGAAFMVFTLLLGPGLLVNVGLKDHAHRPRPAQVAEFGGSAAFRPFYRFDGACTTNCSFVSGEVSSAAWTLAPALLVGRGRGLATAAAMLFAAAVALLRMAAGGHFLSDTIFAVVFTTLLILAFHRLLLHKPRYASAAMDPDALHVGWPAL